MQSRQRGRQVSHAGIAREIIEKEDAVVSFLAKGQLTESQRLRSLGLAIHGHPCPATALGALPQPAAWHNSTKYTSHRPHIPSCGLRTSQPGTCKAGPVQPMGARHPLPPLGHKPSFKQISEFPVSASVIPFDHQHTSPLSDSPTVKPSPSRCRYVQSRFNARILYLLAVASIPAIAADANVCACGAMEGGAAGRDGQWDRDWGVRPLKKRFTDGCFCAGCRATSLSVPSRSLRRPRSRTGLSPTGSASGRTTPSGTITTRVNPPESRQEGSPSGAVEETERDPVDGWDPRESKLAVDGQGTKPTEP